jgi:hypothetical protein
MVPDFALRIHAMIQMSIPRQGELSALVHEYTITYLTLHQAQYSHEHSDPRGPTGALQS